MIVLKSFVHFHTKVEPKVKEL